MDASCSTVTLSDETRRARSATVVPGKSSLDTIVPIIPREKSLLVTESECGFRRSCSSQQARNSSQGWDRGDSLLELQQFGEWRSCFNGGLTILVLRSTVVDFRWLLSAEICFRTREGTHDRGAREISSPHLAPGSC